MNEKIMMHPYFFGYGSLVNRDTHSYPQPARAALSGWRRKWVQTETRDVVFLSAVPDPDSRIEGLMAQVPDVDWQALDAREHGYSRVLSAESIAHELPATPQISHYAVPPHTWVAEGESRILLSYVDVVVQGYLREFGADGVTRFFETTDGWETPILNDRAEPRYPRAQRLSAQETALVDQHLALRAATIHAT